MRSVGKVNVAVPRRLTPVDAQTYWMAAKIPNDQFLLYGFDGVPADLPGALDDVRRRAEGCPELGVRIAERGGAGFPTWMPRAVGDDQFVIHHLHADSWTDCLAAVAGLADAQLDARVAAWRLHIFTPVRGIPTADSAGTVAVLQIAHALGDGIRSSALAAALFGRRAQIPTAPPPSALEPLRLPWRALRAARTHRRLQRDTAAGVVVPQADSRPARHTNRGMVGARGVRTLTRRRSELPGPTVTVAVLAAVADALAGHLHDLGEDTDRLGAEVPMAKAGPRTANNHFGNVGVDLHPQLPVAERRHRIATELSARRQRAAHPAMLAAGRAFAAVPAPLLRWGVAQFDAAARSEAVTGNTVVSSVNRGPADLHFGGAPVRVTAGYPGLSPMMGLTHGVHGIGDTVAVSVHAATGAIGDIDAYLDRLDATLR
ncbi:WS/DGAT domain-containing protein [Mycolicibacterium thermoresistibile]